MSHRLIKVIFEYDDTIEELESPDPDRWLQAINGCLTISQIHGNRMVESKWKIRKKKVKPSNE